MVSLSLAQLLQLRLGKKIKVNINIPFSKSIFSCTLKSRGLLLIWKEMIVIRSFLAEHQRTKKVHLSISKEDYSKSYFVRLEGAVEESHKHCKITEPSTMKCYFEICMFNIIDI